MINQLGLFASEIKQVTRESYDRIRISDTKEIQIGQKVMMGMLSSTLGMGIVTKVIDEQLVDVELLKGKLLKDIPVKEFYYPRPRDLDIAENYYEAVKLLREKKYKKMSYKHKSALKHNADIATLVEIDNINQQQKHSNFINLGPDLEMEVERYVTSMLPGELYYEAVRGTIGEFTYKMGSKVIADRYDRVYVGEITERDARGEWYRVEVSYHYKKSNKPKKLERTETIPCMTYHLEEYSLANLKKKLEKNQ